jgi:parallel beta-helix repeat protein
LNNFFGNGSATSKPSATSSFSNNFGLGLIGTSEDNLVENNKIGGNVNGVYLGALVSGNIIRRNIIDGNPPVQVANSFGAGIGADIRDLSPAGANNFEDNRCLTYAGSLAAAPCPNIAKHDDEDREERDIAAFGRNRLAFPQARLVNAVFHPSARALPRARSSRPKAAATDSITITGKVVDAACYMMHVAAATAPSHKDCGAACLARGVPLAIATDDGVLYFPTDGNARLKTLLNARVRASGTVVEKQDPLELKMPVGDKNQMVVRVEGGYKQITIQSMEKVPAAKRRPA